MPVKRSNRSTENESLLRGAFFALLRFQLPNSGATVMRQFRYRAKCTVLLLACLLPAGSQAGVTDRQRARPPAPGHGLQEAVPIRVTEGAVATRYGGAVRYRAYRADARAQQEESAVLEQWVVLGHGYGRSQKHMAGLAQALARSGAPTATLDWGRDWRWSGNHFRKSQTMRDVANALGARRVVYVGFSAGALAALLAARNDPRALGFVGLDLVDDQGLGRRAARGMTQPMIGLVGAPSHCNANNNGLSAYAVGGAVRVWRIPAANHCDFETPTDWQCRRFCGAGTAHRAAPREDIMRLATAAVHALRSRARPRSPGPDGW